MAGTGYVRRDVLCVLSDWLSALGPALASFLRPGIGGDGGAPTGSGCCAGLTDRVSSWVPVAGLRGEAPERRLGQCGL